MNYLILTLLFMQYLACNISINSFNKEFNDFERREYIKVPK